MKSLSIIFVMFLSLNASSNIEFSPQEQGKAKAEEIFLSRSCFQEMKMHGCGDPSEDIQQFLHCLSEVKPILTIKCKKLMAELYEGK